MQDIQYTFEPETFEKYIPMIDNKIESLENERKCMDDERIKLSQTMLELGDKITTPNVLPFDISSYINGHEPHWISKIFGAKTTSVFNLKRFLSEHNVKSYYFDMAENDCISLGSGISISLGYNNKYESNHMKPSNACDDQPTVYQSKISAFEYDKYGITEYFMFLLDEDYSIHRRLVIEYTKVKNEYDSIWPEMHVKLIDKLENLRRTIEPKSGLVSISMDEDTFSMLESLECENG